jgi:hypothetical protein
MQSSTPSHAPASSGPLPLAPELLKLIGGGGAVSTSTPTPQAPKNKW